MFPKNLYPVFPLNSVIYSFVLRDSENSAPHPLPRCSLCVRGEWSLSLCVHGEPRGATVCIHPAVNARCKQQINVVQHNNTNQLFVTSFSSNATEENKVTCDEMQNRNLKTVIS